MYVRLWEAQGGYTSSEVLATGTNVRNGRRGPRHMITRRAAQQKGGIKDYLDISCPEFGNDFGFYIMRV